MGQPHVVCKPLIWDDFHREAGSSRFPALKLMNKQPRRAAKLALSWTALLGEGFLQNVKI